MSLCVEKVYFTLNQAVLLAASPYVWVQAPVFPPSQGMPWHRCLASKTLTPKASQPASAGGPYLSLVGVHSQ